MKRVVVVCLICLMCWPLAFGTAFSAETFILADRVGEPNARTFFLFSTSEGQYAVRHDGMGEFTSPKGMRRVFNLRVGGRARIENVHYLEHQGDLFLLYEVTGQVFYLVRMEQTKRKLRWSTELRDVTEAPVIDGDFVIVNETQINKFNGHLSSARLDIGSLVAPGKCRTSTDRNKTSASDLDTCPSCVYSTRWAADR